MFVSMPLVLHHIGWEQIYDTECFFYIECLHTWCCMWLYVSKQYLLHLHRIACQVLDQDPFHNPADNHSWIWSQKDTWIQIISKQTSVIMGPSWGGNEKRNLILELKSLSRHDYNKLTNKQKRSNKVNKNIIISHFMAKQWNLYYNLFSNLRFEKKKELLECLKQVKRTWSAVNILQLQVLQINFSPVLFLCTCFMCFPAFSLTIMKLLWCYTYMQNNTKLCQCVMCTGHRRKIQVFVTNFQDFSAVPSSMPTSKTLPLCHSSLHFLPLASSKMCNTSLPCPQGSTRADVRL